MKSALLAAIFGITGGVGILLAVPAEEKAPVVKIHPTKWAEDAPVVPQIEEEAMIPEPFEHYSVAKPRVSMMSFTPKGISDNFPRPVDLCGETWTQA